VAAKPTSSAQITAPLETRCLTVDGGQIAYDDTGGNGPVILAMPGMGDLGPTVASGIAPSRLSRGHDGCAGFW
jgi:hypothetical protein